MGNLLAGKVAVVTGSGRGIGRETVLLMAQEGAKVVVNDLGAAPDGSGGSTEVAQQVVAEIKAMGGQAVANGASVADPVGAESIIRDAVENFGKIDILVNNAGVLRDRMIWNMSDEEWDTVMKVHLYGHFYCTRAAVRWMRDAIREGKHSGGRIINFSSHSGVRGNAGQPNYAAAKLGVVGFTYSLAMACEKLGITANAIVPRASTRLTDTIPDDRLRALAKARGNAVWDAPDIEEVKKVFLGGPPAGIAPMVTWLASDESQHINGEVFMVTQGAVGLFTHMTETKTAYKDGIFSLGELSRAMSAIVPAPTNTEG